MEVNTLIIITPSIQKLEFKGKPYQMSSYMKCIWETVQMYSKRSHYINLPIYTTTSFITLLVGFKAENVLVKQLCYIQTMYRLYRKIAFYGKFFL